MKKLIALVAIAAFVLTATPAFAGGYGGRGGSSDIEVENNNFAFVSNDVTVGAYTGLNSVIAGDATGGNANGGDANGDINTGDANARGKVYNTVNSNETKVKAPCRGCEGDIEVENSNGAMLSNGLEVTADTGLNAVVAGDATATDTGGRCHHGCGGSTTANGGDANGDIVTGASDSYGKVVNVVNTNLTRINRGGSLPR
jgi:hypothetical protein